MYLDIASVLDPTGQFLRPWRLPITPGGLSDSQRTRQRRFRRRKKMYLAAAAARVPAHVQLPDHQPRHHRCRWISALLLWRGIRAWTGKRRFLVVRCTMPRRHQAPGGSSLSAPPPVPAANQRGSFPRGAALWQLEYGGSDVRAIGRKRSSVFCPRPFIPSIRYAAGIRSVVEP